MSLTPRPVTMKKFKKDIAEGTYRLHLRRKDGGPNKQILVTLDKNFLPEDQQPLTDHFLKGLAPNQLRIFVFENSESAGGRPKWRDIIFTNIVGYERVD